MRSRSCRDCADIGCGSAQAAAGPAISRLFGTQLLAITSAIAVIVATSAVCPFEAVRCRDTGEIPTRPSAHLARSRAVSAQVRIRGVSTGAPAGETLASLLDEGGGGIGGVGVLFQGLGPILLKEVTMTTR